MTQPGLEKENPAVSSHAPNPTPPAPLPYKIAVLCYLFDDAGRLLLLHRHKEPNRDLYSPVGGKLEQAIGESPTACALREVLEETGLTIDPRDLHLTGIVSEAGFMGSAHWLMFLYEVTRPVKLERTTFDEGTLEWHTRESIGSLPIPDTDRLVIWPMFWQYRGRFFCVHIDCTGPTMTWRVEQPAEASDV
jgi:8-oxo-dGTP diphosphatase